MSATDFRRSVATLPSTSQEPSARSTTSCSAVLSDDGSSPTIEVSTSVSVTSPCSSPYSSTISAHCWRALRKLSSRCVGRDPLGNVQRVRQEALDVELLAGQHDLQEVGGAQDADDIARVRRGRRRTPREGTLGDARANDVLGVFEVDDENVVAMRHDRADALFVETKHVGDDRPARSRGRRRPRRPAPSAR